MSLAEGGSRLAAAWKGPSTVRAAGPGQRGRVHGALCVQVTHPALRRPPQGHVIETGCSFSAGSDVVAEGGGGAGGVDPGGLRGWLRADKLPLALEAQPITNS